MAVFPLNTNSFVTLSPIDLSGFDSIQFYESKTHQIFNEFVERRAKSDE